MDKKKNELVLVVVKHFQLRIGHWLILISKLSEQLVLFTQSKKSAFLCTAPICPSVRLSVRPSVHLSVCLPKTETKAVTGRYGSCVGGR